MSGSGFFNSPAYKKIMAKVYGFGAALVLAGALFKIQHYPGAGFMLLVGMGTEILIFILSAFEPPHEMPDWSIVFPELVGLEPRTFGTSNGNGSGGGGYNNNVEKRIAESSSVESSSSSNSSSESVKVGSKEIQSLVAGGVQFDQASIDNLKRGLEKLSTTANSIANISNATLATDAYTQSMHDAANSVGEFSTKQSKIGEAVESLGKSYENLANDITTNGNKFTDDFIDVSEKFVNSVSQSTSKLSNAYSSFGEAMEQQLNKISSDSDTYSTGLSETNEKLAKINSTYELQINSLNSQVVASKDLTNNLVAISEEFKASFPDTKKYKQEVENLAQSLVELNTIYGNMLSVMNSNKKS